MKDENVLLQNKPGVENGENWIHYQNKNKESTRAMVADIGDVMAADIKKELVLYNGVLHHNEENFTTFVNKLSEGKFMLLKPPAPDCRKMIVYLEKT